MALRPIYQSLWAEAALPEDIGDADTYVPINPNYPEASPNQYNVGWYVSPNAMVKPPHQWWNSWYQSVDWQFMSAYQDNFGWQPEFEYQKGALAYVEGVRYIALTVNIGKNPQTSTTDWTPAKFYTAAEAESDYQARRSKVDGHTGDKRNPHQVSYLSFGGKSKAEIDEAVAGIRVKADTHTLNTDNPHNVTPEQAGTLDRNTGGVFQGQVGMLKLKVDGGEVRRVSNQFEICLATGQRLGLNTDTKQDQKDGYRLLSDITYPEFRARNEQKFRVPTPDVHLPLSSGLGAFSAPTIGAIEYTSTSQVSYVDKAGVARVAEIDTPGFGADGLKLEANAGQSLIAENLNHVTSGSVFGVVDGVPKVFLGALTDSNLLSYITGENIRDLQVWSTELSIYQIAALGAKQIILGGEPEFRVPTPDVHMPLSSELNAYSAPIGGAIEYVSTSPVAYTDKEGKPKVAQINKPGFGADGLKVQQGAGQVLTVSRLNHAVAGTVFGIIDGKPTVYIGALTETNLLKYFSGTSVRDLQVWSRVLTTNQLITLGVTTND